MIIGHIIKGLVTLKFSTRLGLFFLLKITRFFIKNNVFLSPVEHQTVASSPLLTF